MQYWKVTANTSAFPRACSRQAGSHVALALRRPVTPTNQRNAKYTLLCSTPTPRTPQGKHHDALRVALRLNSREDVEAVFAGCAEPLAKKQLAYLLARWGSEGSGCVWGGGG